MLWVGYIISWFFRVLCFLGFRGLFKLGYMLGLVTVMLGLGFLGLRVLSRLGFSRFSRFSCGMVGFRDFQRLQVLFC